MCRYLNMKVDFEFRISHNVKETRIYFVTLNRLILCICILPELISGLFEI